MPLWALLGLGGVAAYLLLEKSASAQQSGGGYQGTTLGQGGSSTPLGPAASTSSEDYSTTLGPGGSSSPLGSEAGISGAGMTDWAQNVEDLANTAEGVTSNVVLSPGTLQGVTPVSPIPVPVTSGYVGARLAPGARHVTTRSPWAPPPIGGWGGGVVSPPLPPPPVTPPVGAYFDSTLWAWMAWGPTPPASAPQSGPGSWVLVTSVGPDAGSVLDPGGTGLYTPVSVPVWVWYPPADGGLYGIGTSGVTSWAGWTWMAGSDIPVFNSPTAPPAGGYPGSDSWLEIFPNYWVLGSWLAAAHAATPVPVTPPAPPTTSVRRRHAEPRFDPMSRRYY